MKRYPIVKIPAYVIHKDERGIIVNLTLALKSKSLRCTEWITIKAGCTRSQHYHLISSHYCFLTQGKAHYLWRKVGEKKINELVIKEGDCVFTPPMVEHAFVALKDVGLVTLSDSIRSKREYERDVVRLKEKLVIELKR